MIEIDGAEAVALAEILAGVQIFRRLPEGEDPQAISVEEAKAALNAGKGNRFFVPIPEARARAMVHTLVRSRESIGGAAESFAELEAKVVSERARLLNDTAGRVMAKLVTAALQLGAPHDPNLVECAKTAVDAAEAVDAEMWKRIGADMEGEAK